MSSHSYVLRPTAFASAALVAHAEPRRLVVFVHGFGGSAVGTWKGFTEPDDSDEFWRHADLLFFGYKSFREGAKGVADRFRRELPDHYPRPHSDLAHRGGANLRDDSGITYDELYIAAHSLGGIVVRRALLDDYTEWSGKSAPVPPLPPTMDANLRLFSPATAGFRPVGLLGAAFAADAIPGVRTLLAFTANFTDMQPGSVFLESTRTRTERIANDHPDARAVRARIIWANPENVVVSESYATDLYSQSVDGRSHISMCKPTADYIAPWRFVATGEL